MKKNVLMPIVVAFAIFAAPQNVFATDNLNANLRKIVNENTDTVCNVWVFFTDKPQTGEMRRVSREATNRRGRANFIANSESDRRIHPQYIENIKRRGATLRHEFPWGNAASFSVHASRLNEIAALPFVNTVTPVATFTRSKIETDNRIALMRTADAGYNWHSEMVNIHMAHEYLRVKKFDAPGRGVTLAFFDSGFRLTHRAFAHALDSGTIIAAYDFVDNDDTVYDPDSVVNDAQNPHHRGDAHGTMVLSLVAARDEGEYIGAAWGANFALARTEDVAVEAHVEEDNWAAAVLWADSLGADIISSSLGYRTGFDDPDAGYEYGDMDGNTTIVSIAARGAIERGMIVVNAMGNEEQRLGPGRSINAPADVDGVVSVGAVDRFMGIANFSSTGPTADGRIKPELAAPGVSVPVAAAYPVNTNTYTTNSGTSFSTPIVSGILALILQAHPNISADSAKARLYNSCEFSPRQVARDNRYGRGIPNALTAIMSDDEIFLRAIDSTGRPLAGAVIRAGGNVYETDMFGVALINARGFTLPLEYKIFFRNREVYAHTVQTLPHVSFVEADVNRDEGLRVIPNIVRRNNVVRGRYAFSGFDVSQPAIVTVVTLNGKKIWEEELQIRPDGTAEFSWNTRSGNRRIARGTYLLSVRHGYNIISERIIVP